MRLLNPSLAGMKLATKWGTLVVDADGGLEIEDKEAVKALMDLGWKAPSKKPSIAQKVEADEGAEEADAAAEEVEEKKAEEPKAEKRSRWNRSR